jgi:hypothetical protein
MQSMEFKAEAKQLLHLTTSALGWRIVEVRRNTFFP